MSMDAAALSAAIKEMQEANAAGKSDDVVALLKKFKTDVVATEDLLRVSVRPRRHGGDSAASSRSPSP
jgi:transcription elongation factor S-II